MVARPLGLLVTAEAAWIHVADLPAVPRGGTLTGFALGVCSHPPRIVLFGGLIYRSFGDQNDLSNATYSLDPRPSVAWLAAAALLGEVAALETENAALKSGRAAEAAEAAEVAAAAAAVDEEADEEEEAPTCGICFDPIAVRGVLDGCAHHYCAPCIRRWAARKAACPQCQAPIGLITEEHDLT